MKRVEPYVETHQIGHVEITMPGNLEPGKPVDFGVQIAHDGRVWICINGAAFIRFKPSLLKTEPGDPRPGGPLTKEERQELDCEDRTKMQALGQSILGTVPRQK